jgi:aryl-alcohol dehydrogenase-like predicted oxidoreductase
VIPQTRLEGVGLPVSRLVIGCDNRDSLEAGAPVWDAWIEAGGNAFDTAFVYGAGRHEAVLGQWIAARGVASELVVIVKGAHPPHCTPDAIEGQLHASLDRLGLDRAPVYILHRDNPDVPVCEFVDALNRLHDAGLIGAFGGSNWSVARLAEGNAHAAARGLKPMRILNNNLSLAVMQRPVWPGCLGSNVPETLAWLRQTGVAHIAWSAQARGYFLPPEARSRLSDDTAPEACFGGPANEKRRRRAATLAERHGVSAHNIATAWVLAQAFPSLAIVGPRTPEEIASTLPALAAALAPAEVAWLNLETEDFA